MTLPALHSIDLLGHGVLHWGIAAVFGVVYLGMFLGGLPGLKLDRSGVALLGAIAVIALTGRGIHLADHGPLVVVGVLLSNLVSNVPAVMLMLPHLQGPQGETAGVTLALVSTFAGNLLLVGSIANLIVVDLARQAGIRIDWKQHAATGLPVTAATVALAWFWLRA
jgi:Na+/H+ antiporter NhaD/arsenite permease-like protein